MELDRQAAMFYMLVILVIVMGFIAVQLYQLQRDAGPVLRSPTARAIAGLGASV